ncbi:MAG: VWA domain-containing protein [Planctomycetota bacterium]
MILLVLWLLTVAVQIARGDAETTATFADLKKQLIVLGVMVGVSAIAWFAFGMSGRLDFDDRRMLLLGLLAIPLFLVGWRSLQQLEPARRWTSIYLRLFVLFAIVGLLAGFQTVQRHDELTVVALIDTSESVRRFVKPPPTEEGLDQGYEQWLRSYFGSSESGRRDDDPWGVQAFDGRVTVRSRPSPGTIGLPDGTVEQPYDGSNAQRAIESGMAAKTDGNSALRLVLASDGNFTDGDVMQAVRAAAAAGVPIDVIPLVYDVKNEVMVHAVNAPAELNLTTSRNDPLLTTVSVELRATGQVAGRIQLYKGNELVDLNGADRPGTGAPVAESEWRARLDAGEGETGEYALTRSFPVLIDQADWVQFRAVFEPSDQTAAFANAVTANDQGQSFTFVHTDQRRVLVVDGVGGTSGSILPRALGLNPDPSADSDRLVVSVVSPEAMPKSLIQMQRYDAILLHNVPAEKVAPVVQDRLSRYVHDYGGGFAMIGGPDSFGAGGWTNSPIDKFVLPVSCQIPSQTVLPAGALVMVLDSSGSMAGLKGHVAADAAVLAIQTLYPQDLLGVLYFDTRTYWLQKLQENNNPNQTIQKIRKISPGGGTDIDPSLVQAYDALAPVTARDAGVKHVILVTDGHERVANPIATAARYNDANITITTVGIGPDNNEALLRPLAEMTGGTYYSVDDTSSLPQIFIKEARTIRKNLLRELDFDPIVRNVASPVMSGIGDVPNLRGFVLTGPKRDPRIFTPIVGPEGEPIFAHWQVGLGRSAAFTADATNRWGQDWLGWSMYAEFWGRVVEQIARPNTSSQADLSMTVRDDTLVLRVDAAGDETPDAGPRRAAAAFGNDLTIQGAVTGPNNETINVTLEQVGPGIYEARIPVNDAGNYLANLSIQGRGPNAERRRVVGGATHLASDELRTFTSNVAVLQQIAEMTGGRVLDPMKPGEADLYARTLPFESVSARPLRWDLMPWLLLLLLLDVACRRIAWEPAEIAGWAKGRANAVLGIMAPRQPSETQAQTMAALKAKRQQTNEELSQHADAKQSEAPGTPPPAGLGGLAAKVKARATGEPAPAEPSKPTTSRTRKFVASEEDLNKVSDDFTTAVGGAKQGQDAKPIVTAAMRKSEKQQDQGPTTSRLLDAKRRAQQRMQDQDDS